MSAALGAGEVLNVYDGTTLLGQAVVTGTNWTFTTPALSDGTHDFTALVVDAAGNTGPASAAYNDMLDTTAPVAGSAPDLASASDTGASNTDNVTDKTTGLQFTGTGAEAGGSVVLFEDLNGNGVVDSGEQLGSTMTASAGAWTIDNVALAAGTHDNLKISIVDAAGNTSAASAALSVTVNTNGAPTTISTSANINGDHTMSLADFNFADADGGNLSAIRINSTAGSTGTLRLNGVAVSNGQTITASDILAGKLQWVEASGPTTSVKTFDINYDVIDTTNVISLAPSTLTLNRSAAVGSSGLDKDASGESYFGTSHPGYYVTFDVATGLAITGGGHLAIANSASEFTALKGSISDSPTARPTQWVDLLQNPDGPEPGGGWRWADGSAFTLPWVAGEPTNSDAANHGAIQLDPDKANAKFAAYASVPAWDMSVEFESAEYTHFGFNAVAGDYITFSYADRQVLINGMGGADLITGGSGNDTIKVPDTTFASIAGGAGFDLVEFTAAATVNDAALSKMSDVEAIRLGTGAQTIVLDDSRVKAMSGTTDALYVQGDAGDTVQLNGGVGIGASQWHLISTANGINSYVYFDATNTATTAKLLTDVAITNAGSAGTPVTTSTSVNINGNHTMSLADFNFADADGGSLSAVRINSTAGTSGTLLLNGAAVSSGQTITASDILAGKLQWVEAAGPTTSVKTFDINYNVIDTTDLTSLTSSTLTLNRSSAWGAAGLVQDTAGGSYFGMNDASVLFSYEAAAWAAINNGGHMSIANTANEFTAMQNAFFNNTSGSPRPAWIHLGQDPNGPEPAGGWQWADGTAFDPNVTPWVTGTFPPNPDSSATKAALLGHGADATSVSIYAVAVPIPFSLVQTEFESAEFTYIGFASGEAIDFSGASRQVLINGMGGADVISGGGGNDTIKVPDTAFSSINGNAGFDVVEFTAAATVNDAAFAKMSHIEAIKLGAGAQDITLNDARVKALSSATDTLYIQGDGLDTVHVNGGVGTGASQWHQGATANSVASYVYFDANNAATTAKLLIDTSVNVGA